MKACPICSAQAFDDAEVCYGCLHRFTDAAQGCPAAASRESDRSASAPAAAPPISAAGPVPVASASGGDARLPVEAGSTRAPAHPAPSKEALECAAEPGACQGAWAVMLELPGAAPDAVRDGESKAAGGGTVAELIEIAAEGESRPAVQPSCRIVVRLVPVASSADAADGPAVQERLVVRHTEGARGCHARLAAGSRREPAVVSRRA